MIADHDRSGYFGASDVRYIVGNTKTKSWEKWWRVKLGIDENDFQNEAMAAGTNYEHPILEYIECPELDKQIIIPELLLRVNYDGTGNNEIFEVKTYNVSKEFSPPKHYVEQVNVQMFAWKMKYGIIPKASIVAYGLEEADYRNFFREIDPKRLNRYPINYDERWINNTFLPNLMPKVEALKNGSWI